MAKKYEGGTPPLNQNRSLEDMWNVKPTVEGLTPDELEQIYNTDSYDSILERFEKMSTQKRDDEILRLMGKIGHAAYDLSSQLDAAVEDWPDQPHAKKCSTNLNRLLAFDDKLLELFSKYITK